MTDEMTMYLYSSIVSPKFLCAIEFPSNPLPPVMPCPHVAVQDRSERPSEWRPRNRAPLWVQNENQRDVKYKNGKPGELG